MEENLLSEEVCYLQEVKRRKCGSKLWGLKEHLNCCVPGVEVKLLVWELW